MISQLIMAAKTFQSFCVLFTGLFFLLGEFFFFHGFNGVFLFFFASILGFSHG